jgi:Uri superfamily endonuclease
MPAPLDLPPLAGAYVIFIDSAGTVTVPIGGRTARLAPGTYLYCGSARGPGGIRARVGRHLKARKALRWHVDSLTAAGNIRGVIVAPEGEECDLFDRLRAVPGCTVPVAGFGSSDCRRCPAHLLRIANVDDALSQITLRPHETFVKVPKGVRAVHSIPQRPTRG